MEAFDSSERSVWSVSNMTVCKVVSIISNDLALCKTACDTITVYVVGRSCTFVVLELAAHVLALVESYVYNVWYVL